MRESKSEVACFRQRQALQEQTAQQGLSGVAIVASHQAITARMEIAAKRLLKLYEEGKQEEVVMLMSTKAWC
ncbi:MAG TPA: hypothetical protein VFB60_14820 [Ktedonobacteraceae bacterium]|nr:hypothetical protein [Ktedonobacteraceae bacterium]